MHGHAHMLHAQSRAKRTDDLINLLFPDSPWTNTAARLFHHKRFLISILSDLCDLSPCPPLKRAKVRNQAGSERRGHACRSSVREKIYPFFPRGTSVSPSSQLLNSVWQIPAAASCTQQRQPARLCRHFAGQLPSPTVPRKGRRNLSDELQYA
jgi:hypothetical protein